MLLTNICYFVKLALYTRNYVWPLVITPKHGGIASCVRMCYHWPCRRTFSRGNGPIFRKNVSIIDIFELYHNCNYLYFIFLAFLYTMLNVLKFSGKISFRVMLLNDSWTLFTFFFFSQKLFMLIWISNLSFNIEKHGQIYRLSFLNYKKCVRFNYFRVFENKLHIFLQQCAILMDTVSSKIWEKSIPVAGFWGSFLFKTFLYEICLNQY